MFSFFLIPRLCLLSSIFEVFQPPQVELFEVFQTSEHGVDAVVPDLGTRNVQRGQRLRMPS